MCKEMYEIFLLCADGTVSLQLMINVLRWTVTDWWLLPTFLCYLCTGYLKQYTCFYPLLYNVGHLGSENTSSTLPTRHSTDRHPLAPPIHSFVTYGANQRNICDWLIDWQDKRLFQCGSQEAGLVKYYKYTCKKWAVGLGYNKNTRYKIHNKQLAIWKIKGTIKYKLHTVLEVGQGIVKEGLIFFSSRVWYWVF